jgi:hypothetical protein
VSEIVVLLKSPAFWFSSVVLAFLLSLLAAYAKDWTDRLIQTHSEAQDAAARRRDEEFKARVAHLKESPELLSLYQTNIVYQKLRQVLYFGAGYAAWSIAILAVVSGHFKGALLLFVFGLSFSAISAWSVHPRLHMLRSVLNAVLEDKALSFVG